MKNIRLHKNLPALLAAAGLAVGVAACGSSASGATNAGSASGTASTTTANTPTPSGGQTTTAVRQGKTEAARLTAGAQTLLSRLAADTGQLASGNSATASQGRRSLAAVHAQALALAARANRSLAAGTPARIVVVQAADEAAKLTTHLQSYGSYGGHRAALQRVQHALSRMSQDLGQLGSNISATSISRIAKDAQSLLMTMNTPTR